MKFQVTFKTAEALDNAIKDKLENFKGDDDYKYDLERDMRAVGNLWIEFGEYVTIELDTENINYSKIM